MASPFCCASSLSSAYALPWSVAMRWPNCFTASLAARSLASLPSSTSIRLLRAAARTNLRSPYPGEPVASLLDGSGLAGACAPAIEGRASAAAARNAVNVR
jgi:hypothetical protein